MAVTLQNPVRWAGELWMFRFSSGLGDPTFYVYRNAVLIEVTKCNCATMRVAARDVIEVTDDADALPAVVAEGTVELLWPKIGGAVEYRVEKEQAPGIWDTVGKLSDRSIADGSQGAFRTAELAESVDHEFRVIAVDAAGNESTAAAVTVNIKRHPAAPAVSLTFDDASKKVTIAAA